MVRAVELRSDVFLIIAGRLRSSYSSMVDDAHDLNRVVEAQDDDYKRALSE